MSEQPGVPDSQPSIEDRVESMLFGDAPEPQETPEPEPTDDEPDGDITESDEQPEAQDAAPSEDSSELEEINYLGKSYKVPKELANDFKQRDAYTKRTQEVAERARVIEAYEQNLQVQAAFEQETKTEREQLSRLQAQLAQFDNLDLSQLDTDTIVRLSQQEKQVARQIKEIEGALQGKADRVRAQLQQSRQQLIKAGGEYLAKNIPNWGPERQEAIVKQAIAEGFTHEQVVAMNENPNPLTPLLFKLFDKAARLEAIEQRSKSALEKAKSAPPVVKPGASDPQLSERMKTLNFRKQVKTAKTTSEKNALILKRLESKFS
jgi:hypothetical protein